MTSLKSKLAEFLKGLKSDAKPQAPRPMSQPTTKKSQPEHYGYDDAASESEPEEIIIEDMDDEKTNKKTSSKKPFFSKSTSFPGDKKKDKDKKNKDNYGNFVNTQATGDVINVVGCNNFRWGNDYYLGTTKKSAPPKNYYQNEDSDKEEDDIKKCNLIKLLLEADCKPEHEYLDYISQNMDEKWHRFFVKLGFTPGRIKTFIIDNASYGVSEARYGLLLEWVNSKRDPTLGQLSNLLWKHGERRIVKELAIMYSADMAKAEI